MSESLDKAKDATGAAKHLLDTAEPDDKGLITIKDAENYRRLMYAADVQANIAQAEALESIAVSVEKLATPLVEFKVAPGGDVIHREPDPREGLPLK